MYEIIPVQSKDEQSKLAALCGQKFDIDSFAYAAYIDKEFFGICQFKIEKERGVILGLSSLPGTEDLEVIFMTGRAALNFIDLCGVHKTVCKKDAAEANVLRLLKFKEENETYLSADTTNMFSGCGSECGEHKD